MSNILGLQRHSTNFSYTKEGSENGGSSMGSWTNSTGPVPTLFQLAHEQRWRKLKRILRSRNKKRSLELCREKDQSGLSTLGAAIGYRAPLDIIHLIVTIDPCQLHSTDFFGATVLHVACLNGASSEVCKYLIQHSPANAFHPDFDSRIPLHHAIECICSSDIFFPEGMKVIYALCEIDTTLIQFQDKRGDTPIDLIQFAILQLDETDTKYLQLRSLYQFARDVSIRNYMKNKLLWEEAGYSTTGDNYACKTAGIAESCRTPSTAGLSEDCHTEYKADGNMDLNMDKFMDYNLDCNMEITSVVEEAIIASSEMSEI